MAKTKHDDPGKIHMGNVLRQSLINLGYAEPAKVSLQRVIAEVEGRTGKKLTKQRLYNILESEEVTPQTIQMIADGLGVSAAELMAGRKGKK